MNTIGLPSRSRSRRREPAEAEFQLAASADSCPRLPVERPSRFRLPPSAFRVSHAFSLIEVLIVVALLSVIVLGLMAMLNQTQRAFRLGMAQTDVLESGRATTDLLARELQQVRPSYVAQAVNFYSHLPGREASATYAPLLQDLPGSAERRTNLLEDLFFLTCENQRWSAIGYRVGTPDSGVSTLYRYLATGLSPGQLPAQLTRFNNTPLTNLSRVAEGVVHFRVRAYDTNGNWITWNLPNSTNSFNFWSTVAPGEVGQYLFRSNAVPAAVEFELGFLEARALERANSIGDTATRRQFLERQSPRVHLFRQRIPVEAVDVKAYQ